MIYCWKYIFNIKPAQLSFPRAFGGGYPLGHPIRRFLIMIIWIITMFTFLPAGKMGFYTIELLTILLNALFSIKEKKWRDFWEIRSKQACMVWANQWYKGCYWKRETNQKVEQKMEDQINWKGKSGMERFVYWYRRNRRNAWSGFYNMNSFMIGWPRGYPPLKARGWQ